MSMVLHSLRTDSGISLSVVDEFLSISSMASTMSCGEKEASFILDGDGMGKSYWYSLGH